MNGAGPGVHSEGLVLRDGTHNVVFRHNVMEDIGSTAFIGTPTVGHPQCGGTVQRNWYIYGNVFTRGAGTRSLSPNGILVVFDHRIEGDFYFVNNTIIGVTSGGWSFTAWKVIARTAAIVGDWRAFTSA